MISARPQTAFYSTRVLSAITCHSAVMLGNNLHPLIGEHEGHGLAVGLAPLALPMPGATSPNTAQLRSFVRTSPATFDSRDPSADEVGWSSYSLHRPDCWRPR